VTGSARVEEIDVLRGLAALCVMISHYTWYCVKSFQQAPFGFELHTIYGFYAVQLFFIISGFVISLTLEKCNSWRDFAFSRLSRLYPAYWAALSLMVVVEHFAFGETLWVGGYAANLERFDERLAGLLPSLRPADLLIITADHGNDPTTASTDHSREYVPLLVAGDGVPEGRDLGTRSTFADLGQTIAANFGVGPLAHGTSFLAELTGAEPR